MKSPTGYVAVGHLIKKETITSQELVEALRNFLRALIHDTTDDIVHKSFAMWHFDQYIQSVTDFQISSFASFADGIMKRHGAESLVLQKQVEEKVWYLIRKSPEATGADLKWFCIFNRFVASPNSLPLVICPKAVNYIISYLELERQMKTNPKDTMQFETFLQFITNFKVDHERLEKLYNQVVNDVLLEGSCIGKVQLASGKSIRLGVKNKISLTSNYLIVDNKTRVPLIGAKSELAERKNDRVITIVALTKDTVEMIFKAPKQEYLAFKWDKVLTEIIQELIPKKQRKLDEIFAKRGIEFSVSTLKRASESAPNLTMMMNTELNAVLASSCSRRRYINGPPTAPPAPTPPPPPNFGGSGTGVPVSGLVAKLRTSTLQNNENGGGCTVSKEERPAIPAKTEVSVLDELQKALARRHQNGGGFTASKEKRPAVPAMAETSEMDELQKALARRCQNGGGFTASKEKRPAVPAMAEASEMGELQKALARRRKNGVVNVD